MAEPIRKPNGRVQMPAIREVNKPKQLTPRERLLEAIKRARFDARLKMIRLKNNKSRYFRNAAVVATAAGVLGAGAGLAHFASKPNSQPQKPKVEQVERVKVEKPKEEIYSSKTREYDQQRLEGLKRSEQARIVREKQQKADREIESSFLRDPNNTIIKINAIKDPVLKKRYLDLVSSIATDINHFENIYNKLTNKKYKKEMIENFAWKQISIADGGFQHAYDIETLLQIKNLSLRDTLFNEILHQHGEGDKSTVLNTLYHQDEYDALVMVAKTLPNGKRYILELQKQKKNPPVHWDP